jgi:hypothetical protein
MSDFKFACPQCQQHIACGPEYFGRQIACPACGGQMQVPNPNPPAPSTPLVPRPPAPPQAGAGCPSCGAPIAPGAVLCTACGFNLQTGQKLQPRTAPAQRTIPGTKRPVAAAPKSSAWYATPYPYLGLYVVMMFALYLLGKNQPVFKLGFLGMAALYYVGITIAVLVAAFKESAMKGVLCLICGIYAAYWVYVESESTFLKSAYAVVLLLALGLKLASME